MRVNLRDPKCLIKIRRKVAAAVEAANAAICRQTYAYLCSVEIGEFLVPVCNREYSRCYPASIGETAQWDQRPSVAALYPDTARELADGITDWLPERYHEAFINAPRLHLHPFKVAA